MKYVVTEIAPARIAGRRVQAGDTIELTDTAARYEKTAGHIRLFEETSKPVETAVEATSKATRAKS